MTALDRSQLLKQKTKTQKPREFTLPSGGTVLLRVPTAKDHRYWTNYIRDEHGNTIDARLKVSDELLVASILVNPDGTQMFTFDEIMNNALDDLVHIDLEFLVDRTYELFGKRLGAKLVLDEDVEKNSSATQPSEH